MENTFGQKNMFEDAPLTVAKFIEALNQRIKPLAVKIIGEVGEAKPGPTGHMYFSLKDENGPPLQARLAQMGGGAVLSCVIWRSRYEMFGLDLKPGDKIIAAGRPEIYPPSGRLSFICDTIELAGEGALKKEYDRLLKLLTAEGIFEPAKKRPIPKFARRIGIITSKQGAVIHDFLNNIGKFGFQIEFIDSRVEGQLAVSDLLASLKTFRKRNIEALVVMRGGGSLEALMAFNNEHVVREIATYPVPVIAGIGHDKDVPLAAMAADIAVSTPTAAANLLTQSWQEIFQALDHYETDIIGSQRNWINQARLRLSQSAAVLGNFKYILRQLRTFLDSALAQAHAGMKLAILGAQQQLEYAESVVAGNNPERQLKLGYSISRINGKVIKKISQVAIGDKINTSVSDGVILSEVEGFDQKKGVD